MIIRIVGGHRGYFSYMPAIANLDGVEWVEDEGDTNFEWACYASVQNASVIKTIEEIHTPNGGVDYVREAPHYERPTKQKRLFS